MSYDIFKRNVSVIVVMQKIKIKKHFLSWIMASIKFKSKFMSSFVLMHKIYFRQKVCKRYNFGYNPDLSDIRLEVTAGHSPIINNVMTARTAFSPNSVNSQEQPLANQPNVWGPVFRSREAFLEMHIA